MNSNLSDHIFQTNGSTDSTSCVLILSRFFFRFMAASGNDMASEDGTQGNVALQLQCSASSSAEDVKKLLEEKLDRQLTGYVVIFNGTEVNKCNQIIIKYFTVCYSAQL